MHLHMHLAHALSALALAQALLQKQILIRQSLSSLRILIITLVFRKPVPMSVRVRHPVPPGVAPRNDVGSHRRPTDRP